MNFVEFLAKYQKKPVEEYPNKAPENPLVSVCVQTYQHANYIRQCLDGILMQQTDFPFEILLGEDCSTDGTREICLEYAQKHPDKIRLFLHDRANNIAINGTPTGRFNFLFNLYTAQGRYVALCEGDDYWTDSLKLQKQVDFLEENKDYVLTVGGYLERYLDSGKENTIIKYLNENDFNVGYSFTLNDTLKGWITQPLTSLFIKDSDLISQFCDYRYGRDINLYYHILKKGKGFYFTQTLGVYNRHQGGIFSMQNKTLNNYLLHYHIYKELYLVNNDEFSRRQYHSSLKTLIYVYDLKKNPKSIKIRKLNLFIEGLKTSTNTREFLTMFFTLIPARLKNLIKHN